MPRKRDRITEKCQRSLDVLERAIKLTIYMYDIAGLFQKAYSKVASMDKAISGFRATDISPINTDIFNDEDYYVVNTASANVVDDRVSVSNPHDTNQNNQRTVILSSVNEIQSPERFNSENVQNNDGCIQKDVPSTSSELNEDLNSVLTLISPQPSTSREVRKRTHKQHSQIITATPNKTILEEKKKKRVMKENKAPKGKGKNVKEAKKKHTNKANEKTKKNLFKDDTSSSDESDNYQNICDDNSSDYVDENSNMCMICCESGKSNEMWYRCRSGGEWAHAQCSRSNSAKDYICDFCIRQ